MSKFETAQEALAAWDSGEPVWTVEMGGMGPGYEQAIQITGFECLRYLIENPPDWSAMDDKAAVRSLNEALDKHMWSVPDVERLGLSGAQAGAAKNIGCVFARHGHAKALDMVEADRRILVSKNFPGA